MCTADSRSSSTTNASASSTSASSSSNSRVTGCTTDSRGASCPTNARACVAGVIGLVSRKELLEVVLELGVILLRGTFVVFVSLGTLAAQIATATDEVFKLLGGQDTGGMVLGAEMVSLVDGNGGVDDLRLDGLLLDDGLNSLVNVVVHMFTLDGSGLGVAVLGFMSD